MQGRLSKKHDAHKKNKEFLAKQRERDKELGKVLTGADERGLPPQIFRKIGQESFLENP